MNKEQRRDLYSSMDGGARHDTSDHSTSKCMYMMSVSARTCRRGKSTAQLTPDIIHSSGSLYAVVTTVIAIITASAVIIIA